MRGRAIATGIARPAMTNGEELHPNERNALYRLRIPPFSSRGLLYHPATTGGFKPADFKGRTG
jgi:hypothetical protein